MSYNWYAAVFTIVAAHWVYGTCHMVMLVHFLCLLEEKNNLHKTIALAGLYSEILSRGGKN